MSLNYFFQTKINDTNYNVTGNWRVIVKSTDNNHSKTITTNISWNNNTKILSVQFDNSGLDNIFLYQNSNLEFNAVIENDGAGSYTTISTINNIKIHASPLTYASRVLIDSNNSISPSDIVTKDSNGNVSISGTLNAGNSTLGDLTANNPSFTGNTTINAGNLGIGKSPDSLLHIYDASGNQDLLKVSTDQITINKNIIPVTDNDIDIGSDTKKIKDLYVSENSIWMGDDHKIGISNGKMVFRKRKKNIVPNNILNAGGNQSAALAFAGVASLADMKLSHWKSYMRTLRGQIHSEISDIFNDDGNDFDEEISSGLWNENGSDISYLNGNVGIGNDTPQYNLDVQGNIRFTGDLYDSNGQIINLSSSNSVSAGNPNSGTPNKNTILGEGSFKKYPMPFNTF